MKLILLGALIGLLIGGGGGYTLGGVFPIQSTDTDMEVPEHTHHVHNHSHHQHGSLEIVAHENLPEIDLVLHKDPKSGWNAQILLENMVFAPAHASTQHVDGEGHAHIYINGEKINRVYSEWYHFGALEPGTHTVTVTLSTNDHMELTHDGQPISDTEVIEVK